MSSSIVVPKSVQKQLDRLPEQVYQRIYGKKSLTQLQDTSHQVPSDRRPGLSIPLGGGATLAIAMD